MSDFDSIGREILILTKIAKDYGGAAAICTLIARVKAPRGERISKIKEKQEQTLFVKPNGYNGFPKIYDEEGAEFVVTFVDSYIKGKITKKVAEFVKEANMQYALTRLEKGFLVDNQGYLISNITKAGNQRRVKEQIISTNDGVCMKVVKRRIEGGTRNGVQFTTGGIDPIKAMSENGAKANGLTLLGKAADNMTNLFAAAQFILDLGNDKRSFSIMPGITPFTAAIAAVGMLGDIEWRKLDQAIDQSRLNRLEEAKKDGLKEVVDFVNNDIKMTRGPAAILGNPIEEGKFAFYLIEITEDTASNLLANKFETLDDMLDFDLKIENKKKNTVILVKKVGHPDFVKTIYIVEEYYILKK